MKEALLEEVVFWEKMLNESHADPGAPEYQRMVNALRLAEYRLDSLHKENSDPDADSSLH